VVSTLPVGRLLQAIDGCPPEPRAEAGRLASRSTVLVYLRVAGPCFGHHYLTVFDHSLEVGRITNFSRWSDAPPTAGDSVLCMEYWCGRGDALWQQGDAAIVAKAVRELAMAGLCEPHRVQDGHVLRLLQSHPVLTTRHHAALDAVNAYLGRFDNLLLAGRHATFRWDGQTDNIVAGMRLADAIRERFPAPTQPMAPLRRRAGLRTSSAAATSAGSPR
jgi:protoporphyrinogen oxidase